MGVEGYASDVLCTATTVDIHSPNYSVFCAHCCSLEEHPGT